MSEMTFNRPATEITSALEKSVRYCPLNKDASLIFLLLYCINLCVYKQVYFHNSSNKRYMASESPGYLN